MPCHPWKYLFFVLLEGIPFSAGFTLFPGCPGIARGQITQVRVQKAIARGQITQVRVQRAIARGQITQVRVQKAISPRERKMGRTRRK